MLEIVALVFYNFVAISVISIHILSYPHIKSNDNIHITQMETIVNSISIFTALFIGFIIGANFNKEKLEEYKKIINKGKNKIFRTKAEIISPMKVREIKKIKEELTRETL